MPRALVLGNGRLHLNLDEECRLRDIYYPSVGAEPHAGTPSRLGFWSEGAFAWFDAFERRVAYQEDTLVSEVVGRHPELGLEVRLGDAVDHEIDALVRQVELRDLSGRDREVRVFFHHHLSIGGADAGDTACYDPSLASIIHYRGNRYFLIGGQAEGRAGLDMFTCGRAGYHGLAGTWADAEDGELTGHPIEQGAVDSCAGLRVQLPASGHATVSGWLCVATAYREVAALDELVRRLTPAKLLTRTAQHWRQWVASTTTDLDALPPPLRSLHIRSLLLARALCDNGGGVVAATDRDILDHARDSYCYVWPRDGALLTNTLDRAGFAHPLRLFLGFCARRYGGERGYLLHKYAPDGSLGPSWHPWLGAEGPELPIQEDETALVVWALGEHHRHTADSEFVRDLYHRVVEKAADFMVSYRDWRTGLPLPSWDLWEERRGVHAFTAAAVHAGLRAAAELAAGFGEMHRAALYAGAADEVRGGVAEHLWDPQAGRFARQLIPRSGGDGYDRDPTVDASTYALHAFGMFAADDPRVVATMEAVRDSLWVHTEVGGIARYQRDWYHCVDLGEDIPGNPWIICTLWLAGWHAATARSVAELDATMLPLLEWVARQASPAGVLPEQVHPHSGAPLSVAPLAWSHSAFASACLTYVETRASLQATVDESVRSA
ncbi:MAG: glycoside hydrolase family 15 protein [Chloroflexi bacterium]|nr:MAG: glycoside hydrolase family 15 protein [Chloroflexota bacterium]